MFNIQWNPKKTLKEMEREVIELALEHYEHNRTQAARALGICVRTMQSKIKKLGLPRMLPGGAWEDAPTRKKHHE